MIDAVAFYYRKFEYHVDVILSVALVAVLILHYSRVFLVFDTEVLVAATCLGTLPVFISAVQSLREKDWASMDMLASIALILSIASNEFASAVFISLMLSFSRILENITERKTRKNIDSLLKLRPEKAKVDVGGILREVKTEDIHVGDNIIVDVGEYIPIDGVVLDGVASINESSLTGESLPVEKEKGDLVSSGTFVVSGSLKIQTKYIGEDTSLEKIIRLVEQAQEEKPKTQTLGERFGKVYLVSVFVVATALFLWTRNLPLVLSVVLVVCADDVAVAIPLGYLKAIGSAAKQGVIIKGGKHLEALGKVNAIVFDKTGTLTTGVLQVTSVVSEKEEGEEEVIRIGSIVSRRSNHPLAIAITAYGDSRNGKETYPEQAEVIEGKGVVARIGDDNIALGREVLMQERGSSVSDSLRRKAEGCEARGESVSYIEKNGEVIGFFAASDTIKPDAKKTIKALYSLGIKKIVILSGDNERVVRHVAEQVGIKDFEYGLLPEGKLDVLRKLHKSHVVSMVGDGVNDAAALSISHVGIAMGALGSDSAIESAEIVLMHDSLSSLPKVIQLARDVHTISLQDFGIWVITNAFGLVLVFCGVIGPAGAAAYNFISDFFPLLNSMRVTMK